MTASPAGDSQLVEHGASRNNWRAWLVNANFTGPGNGCNLPCAVVWGKWGQQGGSVWQTVRQWISHMGGDDIALFGGSVRLVPLDAHEVLLQGWCVAAGDETLKGEVRRGDFRSVLVDIAESRGAPWLLTQRWLEEGICKAEQSVAAKGRMWKAGRWKAAEVVDLRMLELSGGLVAEDGTKHAAEWGVGMALSTWPLPLLRATLNDAVVQRESHGWRRQSANVNTPGLPATYVICPAWFFTSIKPGARRHLENEAGMQTSKLARTLASQPAITQVVVVNSDEDGDTELDSDSSA